VRNPSCRAILLPGAERLTVFSRRLPDYDCRMRASPPPALELGAADAVEGRPFANAAETDRDAAVMSAMLELQRTALRGWPASKTGPVISDDVDHDGCKHFLAVPDAAAILTARDVTAIGFFGQAREGRDDVRLFEIERGVVASFPLYASQGLLSYYDRELEPGTYGNLILFSTSDVPPDWYENEAHERAVETSPHWYHSVRLHKGTIPGRLLDGGELTIERTKYFDFDTRPTWRALRRFTPA
jgi:hypothetical protein